MILHHIQLEMPRGSTSAAAAFYCDLLGLSRIAKPPELALRGGIWVKGADLEIHLAEVPDFVPQTKGHPGILVADLDALVGTLRAADHDVKWDELFPGHRRCYVRDPFGNRLEFLEPRGTTEDFQLTRLDPLKYLDWTDDVVAVYGAAFESEPYNRTPGQVEAFRDTLHRHINHVGFIGFSIRDANGRLIGFTYGYPSMPDQWWHRQIREGLGPLSDPWLTDAFEYVELAVDPRFQRLGLGRKLHNALMGAHNNPRALLTTLDSLTAGRCMYETSGWSVLVPDFRFEKTSTRYVIMGWQRPLTS